MAVASDYPITFPYGATSDPYSPASPHKGEDRVMPIGTPVLVNGVQIGKSGNTGFSTGAHLHIGKFTQNGSVLPPTGQGFSFASAKVVTISSDATNGNYVRILGDGYYYVYLHLSVQTCTTGQVLIAPSKPQGDEMITSADQASKIYRMLRPNGTWNEAEINSTVGQRSYAQFVNDAQNEITNRDSNIAAQAARVSALETSVSQLSQSLLEDKAQIIELNKQLNEATAQLSVKQTAQAVTISTTPTATITPAKTKDYSWFTKLVAALLPKKK